MTSPKVFGKNGMEGWNIIQLGKSWGGSLVRSRSIFFQTKPICHADGSGFLLDKKEVCCIPWQPLDTEQWQFRAMN